MINDDFLKKIKGFKKIVSMQNIEPYNEFSKTHNCNFSNFFSNDKLLQSYKNAKNLTNFNLNNSNANRFRSNHNKDILSLIFFKYYDLLISNTKDGKINIYNKYLVRTFIGHSMPSIETGLSKDEAYLTSASYDGWIKTWDIEKCKCTNRLFVDNKVCSAYIGDTPFLLGNTNGMIYNIDNRMKNIAERIETCNKIPIKYICKTAKYILIINKDSSLEYIEKNNIKNKYICEKGYKNIIYDDMNCAFFFYKNNYIYEINEVEFFNTYTNNGMSVVNKNNKKWLIKDPITFINILPDKSDIFYVTKSNQITFLKFKIKWQFEKKSISHVAISQKEWNKIAIGYSDGCIQCWK